MHAFEHFSKEIVALANPSVVASSSTLVEALALERPPLNVPTGILTEAIVDGWLKCRQRISRNGESRRKEVRMCLYYQIGIIRRTEWCGSKKSYSRRRSSCNAANEKVRNFAPGCPAKKPSLSYMSSSRSVVCIVLNAAWNMPLIVSRTPNAIC